MDWNKAKAPGGDLPWMCSTKPKQQIYFTCIPNDAVEVDDCGPDGEWNGYQVEMTEIVDDNGEEYEEDGLHEVPFWAMMAFYGAIMEMPNNKRGKEKQFAYTRIVKGGKSVAEIE